MLLDMEITISPLIAKFILRFNPLRRVMVVCKGYGEDMENFTELVWADDSHLDFGNREEYPEFRLWIN